MMQLVIAEKPSAAQSIAEVLGARKRRDGYLEGGGYIASWCVGPLIELAPADAYDPRYAKGGLRICRFCPSRGNMSYCQGRKSNKICFVGCCTTNRLIV